VIRWRQSKGTKDLTSLVGAHIASGMTIVFLLTITSSIIINMMDESFFICLVLCAIIVRGALGIRTRATCGHVTPDTF
jgi:hypothetical protein